jgi:hypothetical protein
LIVFYLLLFCYGDLAFADGLVLSHLVLQHDPFIIAAHQFALRIVPVVKLYLKISPDMLCILPGKNQWPGGSVRAYVKTEVLPVAVQRFFNVAAQINAVGNFNALIAINKNVYCVAGAYSDAGNKKVRSLQVLFCNFLYLLFSDQIFFNKIGDFCPLPS